MKFIVNHGAFNTVEVKLHWETKRKIKNVVVGLGAITAVAGITYIYLYNKKI